MPARHLPWGREEKRGQGQGPSARLVSGDWGGEKNVDRTPHAHGKGKRETLSWAGGQEAPLVGTSHLVAGILFPGAVLPPFGN